MNLSHKAKETLGHSSKSTVNNVIVFNWDVLSDSLFTN